MDVMIAYLVKRLVVHHGKQLCVCRLSVRSCYVERPCLALSRCESVTECGPLKVQPGVGKRTFYASRMNIRLAVLHPRHCYSHAVAPLFLISNGTCAHLVMQVGLSLLYYLIAGHDGVNHVLHIVGRTHLYVYGRTV